MSALGALGAVGLSACGNQPAAPQVQVQVPQSVIDAAAPFRGGSVGMLSQKLYSEAANQALDRSLQSFAQATGTTVQNDLVSGDAGDMVAKMDADVKASIPRDLAFVNDSRFVGQLHNLGDLTDVTDVVEEMKKLYGEPATEANNYCVFDGRWYAIPYHFIASGMYLRKDWYEEKGLPLKLHYTWEELRDNALEVSDPAKRRFGWGLTVNRSGDANGFIENVINTYGGSLISNDGRTVVLNSPETVEALDYLLGLHEEGSMQTPAEIGATWCGEAFGTGRAAMTMEGNWLVPAMDNDFPDTPFEMAELPEGVQQGNLAFTVAYSMGVDSPNKDQAWVLLQYLTGTEGMGQWTSLGLALPARDDVEPAENREALVAGLEYATAYGFPSEFIEVQDAFNNALTSALESGGTGQEIVDAATGGS
jgi:ABC-type glycerol-3-phosphate transport system substrate-binding protein